MKATEDFKQTIQKHLVERASNDPLFAKSFNKEWKNADDCVTYILNAVKRSGCTGFTDDEVYNMAVHYYDEDDIEIGDKNTNATVVVNHKVEKKAPVVKPVETKAKKQETKKAPEKPTMKVVKSDDKTEDKPKVTELTLF